MANDDTVSAPTECGRLGERKELAMPKFKSILSQCFAALASDIVLLTVGNFSGFTSVLISKLYDKAAGNKNDEYYISWFSSYLFLPPVGAIVIGLVSQNLGSKTCMLIAMASLSSVWLIFHLYADNQLMVLVAAGILALSLAISPAMTYTAETSEPRFRSVILATSTLSMYFGAFLTVFLCSFIPYETVALINLGWTVMGLVVISFIPDSPYWLSSKGRFDEARKALAWLRGWTTVDNVGSEFDALRSLHTAKKDTSAGIFYTGSDWIEKLVALIHKKSFYIPLVCISYMFMVRCLTGCLLVKIYAGVILQKIQNKPQDSDDGLIDKLITVVFAIRFLGTICYVCCIKYLGKKKLACSTMAISGFSNLVTAASIYLRRESDDSSILYQWISITSLLFFNFISCAGFDPIINDLNGELFPTEFRNTGAGLGYFVYAIFMPLTTQIFLFVVNSITLQGTFLLFTITCFVGSATFYFIVPVTEGKSLLEIENRYSDDPKEIDLSIKNDRNQCHES